LSNDGRRVSLVTPLISCAGRVSRNCACLDMKTTPVLGLRNKYPLDWSSHLRCTTLSPTGLALDPLFCWGMRVTAWHPKTLNFPTSGFFPLQASCGVIPCGSDVQLRHLLSSLAARIASPHHCLGSPDQLRMVLMMLMRVAFLLSATPFCCGV